MTDPRVATHLLALDRAFDGRGWHGPTLLGSVADVTEAEAAWRPAPGAHNAWEYLVHAGYWTRRALRLVAAEPPAQFDEPGTNFFERPAQGRTLTDDLDRLRDWHRRLVEAVRSLDPARLDEVVTDGFTVSDLLAGVAAHDAYHAGQIGLLRRLHEARQAD